MFLHVKKVLGYTSIIALLNSSVFSLYAVQHKHNPFLEDPEAGSKQHRLPQQDAKTEEKPSRPVGLVLEDYLTENLQKLTPDFVKESYNDFCDWLGNSWFAQTAKEVGATADAKTLFEVDYKDPRYWQFHFTDVLGDLKTLKPAKAKERLIELQSIVWHGLLSPFTYERKMETLKSLKPKMKQIRKDFRDTLKTDRDFLKASFARDSLRFLENFGQQKEGIKGSVKGLNSLLNYYVQVQNSFDYKESLDDLWHFVLRNRSALSLTPETYGSLNDALFKAMMNAASNRNQREYEALKLERKIQVQKTWETRLAFLEELSGYDEDSTFNSALPPAEKIKPVSFVEGAKREFKKLARAAKEGLVYASENPGKTIVTGLLAQVTAAAAWNAFKAPNVKTSQLDDRAERKTSEKQTSEEKVSPTDQISGSHFPRHMKRQIGNEFQINEENAFQWYSPVVNVNNSAFVVWGNGNDPNGRVFSSNGSFITGQLQLDQTSPPMQTYPDIASINDTAFVVWGGFTAGNNIYGRVFSSDGTPLTGDIGLYQNSSGYQRMPRISNINNNAFVVWYGSQTGDNDIYGSIFSAVGNAISNVWRLNENTTSDQVYPAIANVNDNAFSTWGGDQTGSYNIYGRVFSPNGTALTNDFQINQVSGIDSNWPTSSIANIGGNAFVGWNANQTGHYGIYGRIFSSNGTALTDELELNQNTTIDHFGPTIVNINGNALVMWSNQVGNSTIYGSMFSDNGSRLTDDFAINQRPYGQSPWAANFNGSAFVTWQEWEGGGDYNVYGVVLSSDYLETLMSSYAPTPAPTPISPTPFPTPLSPPFSPTPNPVLASSFSPINLASSGQPGSGTAIGLGVGIPVALGLVGAGIGVYACKKKGILVQSPKSLKTQLHQNEEMQEPSVVPQSPTSNSKDDHYDNVSKVGSHEDLYANLPKTKPTDHLYDNIPQAGFETQKYDNVPQNIRKSHLYDNIPPVDATRLYANVPAGDRNGHYANVPKGEGDTHQYDNVPNSQVKPHQYNNIPTSVTENRQDENVQYYDASVLTSSPLTHAQKNEYETLPTLQSGARPNEYGGEGVTRHSEYGGEIPKENK